MSGLQANYVAEIVGNSKEINSEKCTKLHKLAVQMLDHGTDVIINQIFETEDSHNSRKSILLTNIITNNSSTLFKISRKIYSIY